MQRVLIISSRENKLGALDDKLIERGYDVINVAREDVSSYELLEKKAEEIGNTDNTSDYLHAPGQSRGCFCISVDFYR